jgi:hypothetical protein
MKLHLGAGQSGLDVNLGASLEFDTMKKLFVVFMFLPLLCYGQSDEVMQWLLKCGQKEASVSSPTNIPQWSKSIIWLRNNENTNASGWIVNSAATAPTNNSFTDGGATTPTWVSAAEGRYYDGGDYNYIRPGSLIAGYTAITWSVWVKLSNHVESAGMFVARQPSTTIVDGLMENNGGNNGVFFRINGSANATSVQGINETGVWHHVVGTWAYTGLTSNRLIYVDGILVSSTTTTNRVITNTGFIYVGFDTLEAARKYKGNIDDALLYDAELTSNEVSQLYRFNH